MDIFSSAQSLGVIKWAMLTHAYLRIPLRKIKWLFAIITLTDTLCVASYLMWWFASKETGMVIHDTEFPYWDQVSLKNTTQTFISTSNQVYSYLFQVQTMPGSNGHPSCSLLCWIHSDLHLYNPIWQVLSHLFKFWIVGKITTHLCLTHA